ncbi:hypothetical protein HK104_003691, partial [Borealophlyctis nickersoniae]
MSVGGGIPKSGGKSSGGGKVRRSSMIATSTGVSTSRAKGGLLDRVISHFKRRDIVVPATSHRRSAELGGAGVSDEEVSKATKRASGRQKTQSSEPGMMKVKSWVRTDFEVPQRKPEGRADLLTKGVYAMRSSTTLDGGAQSADFVMVESRMNPFESQPTPQRSSMILPTTFVEAAILVTKITEEAISTESIDDAIGAHDADNRQRTGVSPQTFVSSEFPDSSPANIRLQPRQSFEHILDPIYTDPVMIPIAIQPDDLIEPTRPSEIEEKTKKKRKKRTTVPHIQTAELHMRTSASQYSISSSLMGGGGSSASGSEAVGPTSPRPLEKFSR